MVENRVAQILGFGWRGGRTKKPVKTLKKTGYLMLFFFQFHKMSACFSTDFSASWVPGGPIEPCTAQGVAAV